ncbi:MAG: hypothetical protein CMC70_01350 [Flavobacteriaceae bacterium]|nr:hypothetical protein [Flavobacteriaceae bacterium]|tara:strand:+ start:153 stop:362 length:210 start_codon:yes stop_codon:yes gene_type:complete
MQKSDIQRIHKELTPAQKEELRFLRRDADRCQNERFKKDSHPNATQNYLAAAEELDRFVRELRRLGYHI